MWRKNEWREETNGEKLVKVEKCLNFYAKQNNLTRLFFWYLWFYSCIKRHLNTNKLDSCVPNFCVSLLLEFEDEFPNKSPSGLSPIRRIDLVDLVPSSVILNRPAYRSNPKEVRAPKASEVYVQGVYLREHEFLCYSRTFST